MRFAVDVVLWTWKLCNTDVSTAQCCMTCSIAPTVEGHQIHPLKADNRPVNQFIAVCQQRPKDARTEGLGFRAVHMGFRVQGE